MEVYLIELIETVHHYFTLKSNCKENAIEDAKHRLCNLGDNGVELSEDEVIVNQCINLSNSEETSQIL